VGWGGDGQGACVWAGSDGAIGGGLELLDVAGGVAAGFFFAAGFFAVRLAVCFFATGFGGGVGVSWTETGFGRKAGNSVPIATGSIFSVAGS